MDRTKMLQSLNEEIDKLKRAVSLLQEDTPHRTSIKGEGHSTTHVMNPAARKRISDAQKKRWEKVRADKIKTERAATEKYKSISSTPKKK